MNPKRTVATKTIDGRGRATNISSVSLFVVMRGMLVRIVAVMTKSKSANSDNRLSPDNPGEVSLARCAAERIPHNIETHIVESSHSGSESFCVPRLSESVGKTDTTNTKREVMIPNDQMIKLLWLTGGEVNGVFG